MRATYIGSVLVLAEKRQVEKDGQRGGVGGQDDDLRDTSVEGLGGLVGTLLQLAVVAGLLHEVEDLLGESLVGDGPCGGFGRHVAGGCWYRNWIGVLDKARPDNAQRVHGLGIEWMVEVEVARSRRKASAISIF